MVAEMVGTVERHISMAQEVVEVLEGMLEMVVTVEMV
jgi:hypothetical protein